MAKGLVHRNGSYEFVENVEELDDNDYQRVLSMDEVLEIVRSLVRRIAELERELGDKHVSDQIVDKLVRDYRWKNG